MRNAGPKASALRTLARQFDPSLVLGDLSRAGFGGGPPSLRIRKLGPPPTRRMFVWDQNSHITYCDGLPGPYLTLGDPGHPTGRICATIISKMAIS